MDLNSRFRAMRRAGLTEEAIAAILDTDVAELASNLRNPADPIVSAVDIARKSPINLQYPEYGAKGDGSDATAALTAAVSALGSNGGSIFLPAGTYGLSTTLIDRDNVTIFGEGHATRINATSATSNLIAIGTGGTKRSQITLRDLALNAGVGRTAGAAVAINTCANVRLQDVNISNQFNGVDISGSSNNIRIRGGTWGTFAATNGVGLLIRGGNDHIISGLIMDNPSGSEPKACVRIQSSGGTWISECDFLHGVNGLLVDPGAGQNVDFLFLSQVAFDFSKTHGVLLNGSSDTSRISGVEMTGCWTSSNGAGGADGHGLVIDGTAAAAIYGIQVMGHRSFNNFASGITLNRGSDVVIDGAVCSGNSSPSRGAVAGSAHGVFINRGLSHIAVTNSILRHIGSSTGANSQQYGLYIAQAASDYLRIMGNDTSANLGAGNVAGAASIQNASTGTHNVITGNV